MHYKNIIPIRERFWNKVDKTPGQGPNGTCWLWLGGTTDRGYGFFSARYPSIKIGAHKFAYLITRGVIPHKIIVCHECDTPRCVRPSHLFLGTYVDNMQDARSKGRMATGDRSGTRLYPERLPRGDNNPRRKYPERYPTGEDHHKAKMTVEKVKEMRSRKLNGESTIALALEYGIAVSSAKSIINRKHWKHVD